jgi:hypothetical protein
MNRFTPEEARNNLCPFSFNAPDGAGHCRAHRCMGWRFETPEFDERILYKQQVNKLDAAGKPIQHEYTHRFSIDVQKEYDAAIAEGFKEYTPEHQKRYPTPNRCFIRKPFAAREGYCGLAEPKYGELDHG